MCAYKLCVDGKIDCTKIGYPNFAASSPSYVLDFNNNNSSTFAQDMTRLGCMRFLYVTIDLE